MESTNIIDHKSAEAFKDKQQKVQSIPQLPNKEVELLERALDIDFGKVKPIKARLSRWSAAKLHKQQTKGGFVDTLRLFARKKIYAGAEYFDQYDMLAVYENRDPEKARHSALHENLHAWIYRVNEEFTTVPFNKIKELSKRMQEKEVLEDDDITSTVEGYMLTKLISEGICNVGSNYTGISLNEDGSHVQTFYVNHHAEQTNVTTALSDVKSDFYGFDEEEYVEEVRSFYKLRDNLIMAFRNRSIKGVLTGLKQMTGEWYSLGYKLALIIAESGNESGLSMGASFKLAINNPFKSFNDIINLDSIETAMRESENLN